MSKKRKPSSYVQNIVEQQNRTVQSRVQFENLHPGARQFAEENKLGGSRSYVSQLQRELERQQAINALVQKAQEKEDEAESQRKKHITDEEFEEIKKNGDNKIHSTSNAKFRNLSPLGYIPQMVEDPNKNNPYAEQFSTESIRQKEIEIAKRKAKENKAAKQAWENWRSDTSKSYWEANDPTKDITNPFTYVVGQTETSGPITQAQMMQGDTHTLDSIIASAKDQTRKLMQQRNKEYTELTTPQNDQTLDPFAEEIFDTPISNKIAADRSMQAFNQTIADAMENPYKYKSGPLLLLDDKFRKDAYTTFFNNMNVAQRDAFVGQIAQQQEVLERAIDPMIEYLTAQVNGVEGYPEPEGAKQFLDGYAFDPYNVEHDRLGKSYPGMPVQTAPSISSLYADISDWLDGVITPHIDQSWWSTPVDEKSALSNKLRGVLDSRLSAQQRLDILKNYRSEAYKKMEYWKNGIQQNQQDIDDWNSKHQISEYYKAKERATQSVNILDPDVTLFKMPGLIGSSQSSWIKQAPQSVLSFYGLALQAVGTATGNPIAMGVGYAASAGAAASMPLNIAASRDENYAQIVEGYQDKMKNLLESSGLYKEFLKEGGKKLGTTDPTSIMEAYVQGRYVPTNPKIQELGMRARNGLTNQFEADMLATTGDDIVDAALEIVPMGKISKAARLATKAAKSSKVATWLGEKVMGPAGKWVMKPVEWALDKTGVAAKMDKYATNVAKFARSVPYRVLGKKTYQRTVKALDGFFGDRSIAHRILPDAGDYAYYDTIKKFGKTIVGRNLASAWSEGIEEGKQYLNAKAFAEGKFENDEYRGMFNIKNLLNDIITGTRSSMVMAGIPFGLHFTDDEDLMENIRGGMLGGLFQTGAQVMANQALPLYAQLNANSVAKDAMVYAQKLATLGKIEDRDAYLKGIMYSKKAMNNDIGAINMAFQQYKEANEANKGTDRYIDPEIIDEQINDFNTVASIVSGELGHFNTNTGDTESIIQFAKNNGINPNDKNDRFHKFVSLWYNAYKNEKDSNKARIEAQDEEAAILHRVSNKYFADFSRDDIVLKRTQGKLVSLPNPKGIDEELIKQKVEELREKYNGDPKEAEEYGWDDDVNQRSESQLRSMAIAEILNSNVERNMGAVARINAIKGLIEQIKFAISTNQSSVTGSNRDLKFMLNILEKRLDSELEGIDPKYHDRVLNDPDFYFVGIEEQDKESIYDSQRTAMLRWLDAQYYMAMRRGIEGKYKQPESSTQQVANKQANIHPSEFDAIKMIEAADKAIENDLELQQRIEQDWQDRQFEMYSTDVNAMIQEAQAKREEEAKQKEELAKQQMEAETAQQNAEQSQSIQEGLNNAQAAVDDYTALMDEDSEEIPTPINPQPAPQAQSAQPQTTTSNDNGSEDINTQPVEVNLGQQNEDNKNTSEQLLLHFKEKYIPPTTSSRPREQIVVTSKPNPVTVDDNNQEVQLNDPETEEGTIIFNIDENPIPQEEPRLKNRNIGHVKRLMTKLSNMIPSWANEQILNEYTSIYNGLEEMVSIHEQVENGEYKNYSASYIPKTYIFDKKEYQAEFNIKYEYYSDRINQLQQQIDQEAQKQAQQQTSVEEVTSKLKPADNQPISYDDYLDATADLFDRFTKDVQATYLAKAQQLYIIAQKAQHDPSTLDGVTMTNAEQLIADLYAIQDEAEQYGIPLNQAVINTVEQNASYLNYLNSNITGQNLPPKVVEPNEVVEGEEAWRKLTTTYKASIEESVAQDNPNMKLSDVTGNPDFIRNARFVIGAKGGVINRNRVVITLTITYNGHTYTPVDIHTAEGNNVSVFRTIMRALNALPDGKALVVPNESISRTFGRFKEGQPGTLEEKGIITDDNLWDVEFTNEQDEFGLIENIGYGGTAYQAVIKPGQTTTGKTQMYIYSNMNDSRPAVGTLVYMSERQYDEVSGKMPRVPVNIYMNYIKQNDAEFIADVLLGKYRGGRKTNTPFISTGEMGQDDSEFVQNGINLGFTNLQVLRMLLSVDTIDETGKPHLHIEFGTTPGEIKLVGNVIGDPQLQSNGQPYISVRTFNIINNRDEFVKFLTEHVQYTLQKRIMGSRLRENANDRNHPFYGINNLTGNSQVASLLNAGAEVRFGNSSIVFSGKMLINPKRPEDRRGISGLAWYAQTGMLMSTFDGFDNTLLNIDNNFSPRVEDEHQQQPLDTTISEQEIAVQDEDAQSADYTDALWDSFNKTAKSVNVEQRTSEQIVKDNIRKILGDQFTDEQVSVVSKLFIEKVGDMYVLGRCTKDAIILAQTSSPGVEYHEAFHRVVEFLMSDKERERVYKYFRKEKKNQNLTDLQVAEGLADEFMWFMQNRPTIKIGGIRSFFNAIKAWVQFLSKVGSFRLFWIYTQASRGKYANRKVNENAHKIWGNKPSFNFMINGVDFKTLSDNHAYKDLRDGLAYAILEGSNIDFEGSNIQDLEISKFKVYTNPVIFDMLNNRGNYAKDGIYGPLTEESKDVLREALDNWDVIAPDIVSHVSQFATDYKQVQEEQNDEDKNGDVDSITGASIGDHTKSSYEFSQFSRSSSRVRFFFSRIPETKSKRHEGRLVQVPVRNKLGFPKYLPASHMFNMLLNEAHDCESIQEIINVCKKLIPQDSAWGYVGKRLYDLLNKAQKDGEVVDWDAQSLLTQILTLVRSTKNEFPVGVASKYGIGHKIDLVDNDQQYNAAQYRRDWSDMFASGGSLFVDVNDNGDYVMKGKYNAKVFSTLEELFTQMYFTITNQPSAKPMTITVGGQSVTVDINNPAHIEVLKSKLINALSSLGIQFDKDMLNYMLLHKYGDSGKVGLANMFQDQEFGIMKFAQFIGGLNKDGYLNITQGSHLYNGLPVSKIFDSTNKTTVGSNAFVGVLADWKWKYRHSKDQLNVLVTGGNRFYVISENNIITDVIRQGNKSLTVDKDGKRHDTDMIAEMREDPYYYIMGKDFDGLTIDKEKSEGSLFLKHIDSGGDPIRVMTLGGFKSDSRGDEGEDYSQIVTKEDYLAKAAILAEGGLVSPTMSDKKTWTFLTGIRIPGFNYKTQNFSLNSFPTIQTINGVPVLMQSAEVIKQFLEYIKCEYVSARKVLNDVNGYVDENGVEHSPLPKSMLVDNFHVGAEVKDKNGKIHRVIQGARMSGLTGIYLIDGTYLDFNKVLDENGNYISEEDCLREFEEKFLKPQPKKDVNGQYTSVNEELVLETQDEVYQRQALAISLTLQHQLKNEVEYVEKLGLIRHSRGGNWMYAYDNEQNGLDQRYIDMIMNALVQIKQIKPEDRTIEVNNQLRSEALIMYLNDISVKHIISTIEHEKIFSGNPAAAKWKYDAPNSKKEWVAGKYSGRLLDRTTDQRKRFGGLVSTGQNNDESLGLPSHYTCAEVDNEIVESANLPIIKKLMYEGEVRSALIQQKLDAIDATFDTSSDESKEIVKEVDELSIEECEKQLSEDNLKIAKMHAKDKTEAFKDVDIADGAAYISDEMCENLLKQVGLYQGDVVKAFEILRDPSKVHSIRELQNAYNKVWTTVIGNQKYTAYGTRNQNGTNIPYYHKMALFPMFKSICTGKMANLYEKMKAQGVDMMLVKSAVKLGSQGSKPLRWSHFREDDDPTNENNFVNGDVGSQNWKPSFDREFTFNTYKVRYSLLRKQFNTDPKERETMGLGTQMTKVVLSALIPGRMYDVNGQQMDAKAIRDDIMIRMNNISEKGLDKIKEQFFDESGEKVDVEKLSKFLTEELTNRGASRHQLEAVSVVVDPNTGEKRLNVPMAAQSNINWIQSIIISKINKEVVDINLPGNAFIQRSVWGMEGRTYIRNDKNLPPSINNGKKLKMVNEEGSMDCVLSIDYFEHLIPKVPKKDKNGNIIYKTTITHKMGDDGKWISTKEFVLDKEGNKVPVMQRMSFNEARQYLIDNGIIGENAKANIVGYRIPTQALSSIHALRCVDVLPVTRDTVILPEEFTKITGSDFDIDKMYLSTKFYMRKEDGTLTDEYEQGSIEYESNRLMDDYLALLKDTDEENVIRQMHKLHASIDGDTEPLKSLADRIDNADSEKDYKAYEAYSMHSHIQSKEELIGGKVGIGPHALNNNNQVLTMLYGVEFSEKPNFIIDKDFPNKTVKNIMYRLQARSLHRVNDRFGRSILSWISGLINSHVDVAKDSYISRLNVNSETHNLIELLVRTGFGETGFYFIGQPIIKQLAKVRMNAKGIYGSDRDTPTYQKQREAEAKLIIEYINKNLNVAFDTTFKKYEDAENKLNEALRYFRNYFISRYNVSADTALESLFDINNNTLEQAFEDNSKATFDDQMLCYLAWTQFKPYERALSDLVKYSKIDTKKQGKNLTEQTQYQNGYRKVFIDENSATHKMFDSEGLTRMAKLSYIEQKTENALNAFRDVLKDQLIQATPKFNEELDELLVSIGKVGSTDEDVINALSGALVARQKARFFFGPNGYCVRNNINPYEVANGRTSIYNKILNIKLAINRDPAYVDLRDNNGEPTNYLLKWLTTAYTHVQAALPAGNKQDTFNDAKFVKIFNFLEDENIDQDELASAWEELLNDGAHPDLQQFAKELIVYAFMTSGDNGGRRDLFKYVPNSWKTNTDGLGYENSYVKHVYDILEQYQNNQHILSQEEKDDIILNLWYDGKIVKYTTLEASDIKFKINNTFGGGNPNIFARVYSKDSSFSEYIKIPRPNVADRESQRRYTIYKAAKTILNYDGSYTVVYTQVDARGTRFKTGDTIYEYGIHKDDATEFWSELSTLMQGQDPNMTAEKFFTMLAKIESPVFVKLFQGESKESLQSILDTLSPNVQHGQQNVNTLDDDVLTISYHEGDWSRAEAENDPETLYIFTDNTDRDSGSGIIDDNSWYAQKYGKGHHYPTQTQAVVRGLDNSRPISTQRWFHEGAKGKSGQWQDSDYEEFKKVIDAEIEDIKEAWNSGRYKRVMFGSGDAIFNGRISEITPQRVPRLYTYLEYKVNQLKQDIIATQPQQSVAPNTYSVPSGVQQTVDEQDAQDNLENVEQPIQNEAHPFDWVQGENISSTGSEFAKMLTNPGNNLQVEYKGKIFRNAEHAYQTWKSGQFDEAAYNSTEFIPRGTKPVNKATSFQTMVEILTAKLEQHPELIKGIVDRGGIFYLQRSTHNVKGDKFWESSGQNGFIRALIQAYTNVIQSYNSFENPNNDQERFASQQESVETIQSEKTILSNEELRHWNEHGVGTMPRILVASERTDPAFHVQEILDILDGKKTVPQWGVVNGRRQIIGNITGKDFAGLYLITKHDGLPMKKLLETKIPKLIHFSITGLGGTKYEPGVMKPNDLLDRIKEYINMGLDPESVTIRIDPIVPGITTPRMIENIIKRASEMGIKRIRFSIMDAYQNTVTALEKVGYDFEANYGTNSTTGKYNFNAKPEKFDKIVEFMLQMADKYGVNLGSCAENITRRGISKEGCLSVSAVNAMLGTQIEDRGTDNNDQRQLCSCYGGKTDALAYNASCASHCLYCYAKHENDKALQYYNEDGTLKDNIYTRTSEQANNYGTSSFAIDPNDMFSTKNDNIYYQILTDSEYSEMIEELELSRDSTDSFIYNFVTKVLKVRPNYKFDENSSDSVWYSYINTNIDPLYTNRERTEKLIRKIFGYNANVVFNDKQSLIKSINEELDHWVENLKNIIENPLDLSDFYKTRRLIRQRIEILKRYNKGKLSLTDIELQQVQNYVDNLNSKASKYSKLTESQRIGYEIVKLRGQLQNLEQQIQSLIFKRHSIIVSAKNRLVAINTIDNIQDLIKNRILLEYEAYQPKDDFINQKVLPFENLLKKIKKATQSNGYENRTSNLINLDQQTDINYDELYKIVTKNHQEFANLIKLFRSANPDLKIKIGGDPEMQLGGIVPGKFHPKTNTLTLYNGCDVYTIIHELAHSATFFGIFGKSEESEEFSKKIETFMNYIRKYISDNKLNPGLFSPHTIMGASLPAEIYGFTNESEFIAELYGNPSFQDLLDSIPPMNKKEFNSLLQEFIYTIIEFFNNLLGKNRIHKSALDQAKELGLISIKLQKDHIEAIYQQLHDINDDNFNNQQNYFTSRLPNKYGNYFGQYVDSVTNQLQKLGEELMKKCEG